MDSLHEAKELRDKTSCLRPKTQAMLWVKTGWLELFCSPFAWCNDAIVTEHIHYFITHSDCLLCHKFHISRACAAKKTNRYFSPDTR